MSTTSITVEYDLPHAPKKVWRALTEPDLLAKWLMDNDFSAQLGHRFEFKKPSTQWDGVVKCEVLALEKHSPARGQIESRQQRKERRFARTRSAHDGDRLARGDVERHVVHNSERTFWTGNPLGEVFGRENAVTNRLRLRAQHRTLGHRTPRRRGGQSNYPRLRRQSQRRLRLEA